MSSFAPRMNRLSELALLLFVLLFLRDVLLKYRHEVLVY